MAEGMKFKLTFTATYYLKDHHFKSTPAMEERTFRQELNRCIKNEELLEGAVITEGNVTVEEA
jgi:hypothetical protein